MSSAAEVKEASLVGPVASLTTASGALKGIVRYASSTTNASAALPSITAGDNRTLIPLQGKWMRVANESSAATLDFAFGAGSAPTLVAGQLATFGTGHVSAGWQIPPASSLDFVVPTDATHVAWIQPAGASASTIAFFCAEGLVGDK